MYLRHAGHSSARSARPRASELQLAALAVLASSFVLVSAAHSADLAVKAPAAAHTYNWSGCYVGANAGGSESGSDFTTAIGTGTHLAPADIALVEEGGNGSANGPSWGGGGQVGCNWQSDTVVYGLEGDFDYFRTNPQFINNTATLSDGATTFTLSQMLTTNYLATLRPRLGVAADRNLFYVTGGAAFTKANYTRATRMPPFPSAPASLRARKPLSDGRPARAGNTPGPITGRCGSSTCSRAFRDRSAARA
jgi:opacity protein-like surface antigen